MAAVEFSHVSCPGAVCSCFLLAVAYVGSLYAWKSDLPRDHPATVKRRFVGVLLVTLLAPLYLWLISKDSADPQGPHLLQWLGLQTEGFLLASTLPLLLTMLLFLGPIAMCLTDGTCYSPITRGMMYIKYRYRDVLWLRNFIVVCAAPFTEEFVFRACMLPLLIPCLGPGLAVVVCPLFFGVAHIHHVFERLKTGDQSVKVIWMLTMFQFSYTTVFGAYTAFLFVRTGHLIGPYFCHAFCNEMGFPNFADVFTGSKLRAVLLSVLYVAGLVLFLVFLWPATQASLYSNSTYKWT
ncbi:CAAX prenyl protease 2-like isoform X1 [Branchiostoma floridae]|uniref:CAAX prenyl protease 2 n=1 Tax=Branchiostoma floridae TaxID=7739 RepID=A0A9J7LB80_BRAFL|nr:CAAX prenyl protease 2-like isoform X1 [Branchiostoma floridae]